jgi:manganese oxidase
MNMGSSGTMNMGSSGTMTADEMAKSHKAGVDAFPAETQGTGNQPLRPTVQNGWKVFELTATEVKWEVEPGKLVDAMAYNGQIPGPEIRVRQGDKVRIVVNNQMSQPTVTHFHGMTVPNKSDGVPYITQDPIMPGGYYVYEFTVVDPPGMYVYHSHFNSTEQVGKGLYGALIVEPKGGTWSYPEVNLDPQTGQVTGYGPPPAVDVETILFLGDGPLGYVLNAKSFPATQPIVATRGDWVLIHMANDGSMLHPMHLHGYHFEVVAQDGFPLKDPYMADTLVIAPGQRFDVLVHAIYPGVWAFHCHILPHVEGPQGMYGMVTALVVQ